LIPNSFPPVEALEFSTSPILVSLLCDLKNHDIVGSSLSVRRFLIINLIEQGYCRLLNDLLDSSQYGDGAPRWYCCKSQL
jgi:hypothetical protein